MAATGIKRLCIATFTAAALAFGSAAVAPAIAPDAAWAKSAGWTVSFNGSQLTSDGTAGVKETLAGMQPGDTATFTVDLSNDCNEAANWYLRSAILKTMEEGTQAAGGSYGYRLTYTDAYGKVNVIYDNQAVAGDSASGTSQGLYDATAATSEWFFLDTLPAGGDGIVVLEVSLDPESHGNSYFDSSAAMELTFAAEPKASASSSSSGTNTSGSGGVDYGSPLSATADPTDYALLAVAAAAAGSVMAIARRRMRTGSGGDRL